MTSYGTIPTSSHAPGTSTNLEFISRAKQRIKSGFSATKPWKLMFNLHSFRLPSNLGDSMSRFRTNLSYFRMNYAIILLIILFLSLLWHPISLIVFVVMIVAWLFLYFMRDEPLVVLNRVIDDRIVLGVLAVLTVVFLLLTKVTWNVVGSLLIGLGLIVFHGVFRVADDLYFDDEEGGAGLISRSGDGSPFPTSSSSR